MKAPAYLGFVDLSDILGKSAAWVKATCKEEALKEVPARSQVWWDGFSEDHHGGASGVISLMEIKIWLLPAPAG